MNGMLSLVRAALSRHRYNSARISAIVTHVEATATAEELYEHKSVLLSFAGAQRVHSALQRRIDALVKSDWQPA